MVQSRGKLYQLEGLRGFAAFVVLLHHLRLTFFVEAAQTESARYGEVFGRIIEALFDGNFAVWLFWVMSAFVLSIRFHASKDDSASYSLMTDATIRRYPRLFLPVIVSVFFAWALLSSGLMTNVRLASLLGPQYDEWLGSFYLFEPNAITAFESGAWQTFFAYDESSSYNCVLWTMEIELYGSFFLFAFLALMGKHPARYLVYATTLVVLFRLSRHWLNAFVMGTMICDAYVNRDAIRKKLPPQIDKVLYWLMHNPWVALMMLPPMLYLIGLPNIHGVLHLLLASVVTAYVVMGSPAKNLFACKTAVFLGKISFGFYLAHLPIICAAAFPIYILIAPHASPLTTALTTSIIITLLSIIGGWCLWFVADRPAIAFSRSVSVSLNRIVSGQQKDAIAIQNRPTVEKRLIP